MDLNRLEIGGCSSIIMQFALLSVVLGGGTGFCLLTGIVRNEPSFMHRIPLLGKKYRYF